MRLTRQDLLPSDYETLFTQDPDKFFETVLYTLLWKIPRNIPIQADLVDQQKEVFNRWFGHYRDRLKSEIAQEFRTSRAHEIAKSYCEGHLQGRIDALVKLPIHKGFIGQKVDLTEVASLLHKLKIRNQEK